MSCVEPDELPDVEDLWWSWVVLAALHRQPVTPPAGSTRAALCSPWTRPTTRGCGCSVPTGPGPCSGVVRRSPRPHRRTPVAGAPDWALSDATEERRPTFLAWYAHGEWDTNTSCPDEGAVHLLRPLLTVDPRMVELGRQGQLTPEALEAYAHGDHLQEATELVRLAGADAPPTSVGSVHSRLRDQIHGQMRDTHDGRSDADAATAVAGAVVADQRARRPLPARRAGPTGPADRPPARTPGSRARGTHA